MTNFDAKVINCGNTEFEKLLSPINIGPLKLKNRIVMPAITLGLDFTQPNGIAFYEERARGGAGTIITTGTQVEMLTQEECWGRAVGLSDYLKALPRLSEAIHQQGAKVGFQLILTAPPPANIMEDIRSKRITIYGRGKDIAKGFPPYFEEAQAGKKPYNEFSTEDISKIIEQAAQSAVRAKEAGFDFVEYHACHTYFSLLCQAFSPLTNHRQDKYGGDLAGRMRLGLECIATARAAVGPDFPLCYRLPAMEGDPGGITLDDSTAYAIELEKVGVNILNVSVGPGLPISPLPKEPMGTHAHLAEAVKRHVHIPVIALGKINTPQVAESILAQGKADLVAIGRQLICDPFWPRKVAEGRVKDIVKCDSTNQCYGSIGLVKVPSGSPICKNNPRVGKEREMPAIE